MAETYQQFKVRVTDGQNLVEIDPIDLNEATKNEPYAYVQKLRAEQKAAILAKHKRVVKKPFVTSEIVQGEVSEDVPELVSPAEPLSSSTSDCTPEPLSTDLQELQAVKQQYDAGKIDLLREENRASELDLRQRKQVFTEMVFAWIMGVFSGYGVYLVTKDIYSFVSQFLIRFFTK
jgi:hypothetical protein